MNNNSCFWFIFFLILRHSTFTLYRLITHSLSTLIYLLNIFAWTSTSLHLVSPLSHCNFSSYFLDFRSLSLSSFLFHSPYFLTLHTSFSIFFSNFWLQLLTLDSLSTSHLTLFLYHRIISHYLLSAFSIQFLP